MAPLRKAWPCTRLPMSRPCMSVSATISVSISPERTFAFSSASLGWSPWESLAIASFAFYPSRADGPAGLPDRPILMLTPRGGIRRRSGRDLLGGVLELALDLGQLLLATHDLGSLEGS